MRAEFPPENNSIRLYTVIIVEYEINLTFAKSVFAGFLLFFFAELQKYLET